MVRPASRLCANFVKKYKSRVPLITIVPAGVSMSRFGVVVVLVILVMAEMVFTIPSNALDVGQNTSLVDADVVITSQDADQVGFGTIAGDVNGDGYDDIIIGCPFKTGISNKGKSYLIFGKGVGWNQIDISNADASWIGENADDRIGRTICGAGDMNGDGFDDIIIGSYDYDNENDDDAGIVYLIRVLHRPNAKLT